MRCRKLIIIGGMIGLGKSSVAKLLGEAFGMEIFLESVDDNPILPLFYTATDEEIQSNRYPFLLQLYFLNEKVKNMKAALQKREAIVDRSIYEDWYFAKVNRDLGRISDLEYQIYEKLFQTLVQDIELEQRTLMIYLKGSFETVLSRITERGRDYELDQKLVAYYRKLWVDYDEWILKHYRKDQLLIVDMDQIDIVGNKEDAAQLIMTVRDKWI